MKKDTSLLKAAVSWITSDFQTGPAQLSIFSAPKSRPGWLNLPHSPTLPPPVTAKHQQTNQGKG